MVGYSRLDLSYNIEKSHEQPVVDQQQEYQEYRNEQNREHREPQQGNEVFNSDQNKKAMILDVIETPQLIDINNNMNIFNVGYQLSSMNDVPFFFSLVSQKYLDSNNPVSYKEVNGNIVGRFQSPNNNTDNYFIVIKNKDGEQRQAKAGVKLIFMPPNNNFQNLKEESPQRKNIPRFTVTEVPEKKDKNNMTYLAVGGIILIILIFFVMMISKKRKNKDSDDSLGFMDY